VYSSTDYYKDTGIISFYLGTNKKYRLKALQILKEEIRRVSQDRLPPDMVTKIKTQMKGGFLLGLEDTYNRMSRLAKNEIYFGKQMPVQSVLDSIESISADSILKTAKAILNIDEFNIIQIS
jgi:predicted Zn-dependent peptidase